nr:MFS transporter [Microbacterium ulmi]
MSLAVLLTVTAESLPAGLLPEMSADLGVGAGEVGLLISVWAATVIVTSIPLARLVARIDRRIVLGGALAMFALANVATAFAPDYRVALATRIAAALAHGVFWAVVIVYATSLLAPSHLGRGLAVVTAGGTAAAVAGLPAATVLAHATSWRAAFAVLGVAALAIAAIVLTRMPRRRPAPRIAAARGEGFWRDPSLPALAAFGVSCVLIATAQFASFTYIRPYLDAAVPTATDWAPALLALYGVAGLIGVVVAGFLADRFPRGALTAVLLVFAVAFAALTIGVGDVVVVVAGLVAWGFAIGAVFPLLQTMLMRTATDRTRTLASAGMVVLFNVGIAVGPWLGGLLGSGASVIAVTVASSVLTMTAAAVGTLAVVLARRVRPAP